MMISIHAISFSLFRVHVPMTQIFYGSEKKGKSSQTLFSPYFNRFLSALSSEVVSDDTHVCATYAALRLDFSLLWVGKKLFNQSAFYPSMAILMTFITSLHTLSPSINSYEPISRSDRSQLLTNWLSTQLFYSVSRSRRTRA